MNLVDEYFMVSVGGTGTREEVETDLANALDEYNEKHGTKLIIDF